MLRNRIHQALVNHVAMSAVKGASHFSVGCLCPLLISRHERVLVVSWITMRATRAVDCADCTPQSQCGLSPILHTSYMANCIFITKTNRLRKRIFFPTAYRKGSTTQCPLSVLSPK